MQTVRRRQRTAVQSPRITAATAARRSNRALKSSQEDRVNIRIGMTIGLAVIGFALEGCQQAPPPAAQAPAATEDGATFDADGTAHVTRVVPMPSTVSPKAQKYLEGLTHRSTASEPLEDRRKRTDEWRVKQSAEAN